MKHRDFAKLYRTEKYGQILVELREHPEEEDKYQVAFKAHLNFMEVTLGWNFGSHSGDLDTAREIAEKEFVKVDQDKATQVIQEIYLALGIEDE